MAARRVGASRAARATFSLTYLPYATYSPRSTTINARKLQRTKGVSSDTVVTLEGWIDAADAQLATLHNFILPGGTPGSAALHMARFLMDGLVNNQDRRTLYRPRKIPWRAS
eukprot:scaffold97678_cov75-Phaeocystis_antarctica.AAC.2